MIRYVSVHVKLAPPTYWGEWSGIIPANLERVIQMGRVHLRYLSTTDTPTRLSQTQPQIQCKILDQHVTIAMMPSKKITVHSAVIMC